MVKSVTRCFLALLLATSVAGNFTLAYADELGTPAGSAEGVGTDAESQKAEKAATEPGSEASSEIAKGAETTIVDGANDEKATSPEGDGGEQGNAGIEGDGDNADGTGTDAGTATSPKKTRAAQTAADATAAGDALQGSGTAEDPYLIGSTEALAAFRDAVNGGRSDAHAMLTADIDLGGAEWTPIATEDAPYQGTFDGDGFTVDGLSINQPDGEYLGLFASVGDGGVVQDVAIGANSSIVCKWNGGAIAGYNAGKVSGCTNAGTVRGNGPIGGIVGTNEASGEIANCTNLASGTVTGSAAIIGGIAGGNRGMVYVSDNHANITGELDVGGIVGDNAGGYAITNSCMNYGTVNGAGYVGGIAGTSLPIFGDAPDAEGPYVIASKNHGSVSAENGTVGGVVGENGDGAGMELCFNFGKVESSGEKAGGIVGANAGDVQLCASYASVAGTVSTGGIAGANSGSLSLCGTGPDPDPGAAITGWWRTGGIAGENAGTVDLCNNYIPVSGVERESGTAQDGRGDTGGVVGRNSGAAATVSASNNNAAVTGVGGGFDGGIAGVNEGMLTGCTNSGAVTGDGFTGGIAGANFFSTATMDGCVNNGAVTGTLYVGGIVASNSALGDVTIVVKNCTNNGAVAGTYSVGGIAGISIGESTVQACANTGAVTADEQAGGLVAWNDAVVADCYSTGTVTMPEGADAQQFGTLVGENTGTYHGLLYLGAATDLPLLGSDYGEAQGNAAYQRDASRTGWVDQNGKAVDFATIQAQTEAPVSAEAVKKVDFNVNGTVVATVYALAGESIEGFALSGTEQAVADAIPAGYEFAGWVTASDGTEAFDFAAAITEDTVAYASLTKVEQQEPIVEDEQGQGEEEGADPKQDPELKPLETPDQKQGSKQGGSELAQTGDGSATIALLGALAGAALAATALARRQTKEK